MLFFFNYCGSLILSSLSLHLIRIFSLMVSSLDLFKAVLCANFIRDSAEELLCASWYRERHSVGELCWVQSVPEEKWAWCMFNSYFFTFLLLCIIHPFFCFIVMFLNLISHYVATEDLIFSLTEKITHENIGQLRPARVGHSMQVNDQWWFPTLPHEKESSISENNWLSLVDLYHNPSFLTPPFLANQFTFHRVVPNAPLHFWAHVPACGSALCVCHAVIKKQSI